MSPLFVLCRASVGALILTLLSIMAGKAEVPKVVVSLKPLHSLVSAVMGELGKPDLIVKGVGSEHDYALKPSDAKIINNADVIFIADKNMEVFLQKPLANLSGAKKIISLSKAKGLELLPMRQGGLFEAHHHGEEHEHEHAHESTIDYHFWLDPENAKRITLYVAETLAALDEDHASVYKANAEAYNQSLNQLIEDIEKQIKKVRGQNFIVFHDAYHYFEHRFDIEATASVALDPERPAGAKRIQQLKDLIKSQNIVCIFKEPQFPNKIINVLIENNKVRIGELDPLGVNLESDSALYGQLMRQNAKNLVDCLIEK